MHAGAVTRIPWHALAFCRAVRPYLIAGALVSGCGESAPSSPSVAPPAPRSSGFNLTIAGAYLTQAVQRFDGSVPLVAGRDAFLRVFAVANLANQAQPRVRARLYHGTTLVRSEDVPGPPPGVPLGPNEAVLSTSWNLLVPGALIQPGLRIQVDVDPDDAVAETSEADNRYPVSAPAPVDVRALPVFSVRLVPVLQEANGLQGNVTDANKDQFLADVQQVLPVGAYDADVRAPFTTNAPVVQSDNGNGAWSTILSELHALKAADASSRSYYGVIKTGYASGIAGMGYVGGNGNTAVGWDRLPSGAGIMAHEVGHNLGRAHAPCGSAGSTDQSFPHPGGHIGVWGLNVSTLALKPPTTADFMGYCSPDWVSDYSWIGMIGYRESGSAAVAPAGDGLLVWGRLRGDEVVLEPAFRVALSAEHLPRPGRHRVELLDAAGNVLTDASFAGQPVGDLPGEAEEHFAFVLPVAPAVEPRLAGIRVVARGRGARRQAVPGAGDAAIALTRRSGTSVDLRWDGVRFPMALVRDARTGEVLSFARGGAARITTSAPALDVQLSDGVRGVRSRRPLPPL